MKERLQKIIAAAGICSRRAAEDLLRQGRVQVNGQIAALGDRADPETDTVTLDGQPLSREPERVYLMLNKPRGYVTTLSDERGRRTAAELVSGCGARVYPVGRLDMDSEGLLLMTNDGAWMQRLLHPSREIEKEYRVTVTGPVEGAGPQVAGNGRAHAAVEHQPHRQICVIRANISEVRTLADPGGDLPQARRQFQMFSHGALLFRLSEEDAYGLPYASRSGHSAFLLASSFTRASSLSQSTPWTMQASSTVSPREEGQPRQCMPMDRKMGAV